jgi:hypothetical protein
MFCGNCGSKVVEGDRFCVACGRAQSSSSGSQSMSVLAREGLETPAERPLLAVQAESAPIVDQMATERVPVAQAGEKPSYCRHSLNERYDYGVDREHGSETCLGCGLPYWGSPNSLIGSPDSLLPATAQGTQLTGVKENTPGVSQVYRPASSRPFSGKAIAAFVISLLWAGGIGSIVAIFLATSALKGIRRGTHTGHGLAVAAMILGILGILTMLFVIVTALLGQNLNNQFNDVTSQLRN